ncbi:MAG: hypothetical protein EOM26_01455 [Alphaproteobacteria bacterium]|nr:hypothetical protein [Alphaproteobacteria bacterium]
MSRIPTVLSEAAQSRLAHAKAFFWDFDHTLYRVGNEQVAAINRAIARAAIRLGLQMTFHEAVRCIEDAYARTGASIPYLARSHNLCLEKLHLEAHSNIEFTHVTPLPRLKHLFNSVNDCRHIVITHGSVEYARRGLAHVGLLRFFPDDHILGLESGSFRHKHESTKLFETALCLAGVRPDEAIFSDDSPLNLPIPARMGIGTFLIAHGRTFTAVPEGILGIADTPVDLLHARVRSPEFQSTARISTGAEGPARLISSP